MQFGYYSTLSTGLPFDLGITEIEIAMIGGVNYMFAASRADGALYSFRLSATGAATFLDRVAYSATSGTLGISDLDILQLGGQTMLVNSGSIDDAFAYRGVLSGGAFGAALTPGGAAPFLSGINGSMVVTVGTATYLFNSHWGQQGFYRYLVNTDFSLVYQSYTGDTTTSFAANVTAMATATVGGNSFVFVASGTENGISTYSITASGTFAHVGVLAASGTFPISTPTEIETVVIGATTYLVVGSAGSSSLTVLRVASTGVLTVMHHVIDDLTTRFQGVSALETIVVNGRALVFVGGADDGVTVFELAPDGGLYKIATISDKAGLSLQNVADIAAVAIGNAVQFFVSSADNPGVSQFTLSTASFGSNLAGTNADNTITGTALDDTIFGANGNDILIGGDGNDRLIDGNGIDTMTGGAGRNNFVFYADGAVDTVTDFKPGTDKMDLSRLLLLHGFDQLQFTQGEGSVTITFGVETIIVRPASGTLTVADFTPDDFIF